MTTEEARELVLAMRSKKHVPRAQVVDERWLNECERVSPETGRRLLRAQIQRFQPCR